MHSAVSTAAAAGTSTATAARLTGQESSICWSLTILWRRVSVAIQWTEIWNAQEPIVPEICKTVSFWSPNFCQNVIFWGQRNSAISRSDSDSLAHSLYLPSLNVCVLQFASVLTSVNGRSQRASRHLFSRLDAVQPLLGPTPENLSGRLVYMVRPDVGLQG